MFIMGKEENSRIWFAVINGYAASKKAGTLWKAVDELLKKKGVTYHGTRTGKAGTAAELTFDACMAGYRRFVAVGGDGTVHDVLNGIAAYVEWTSEYPGSVSFSDFTLGVIPLGSGNDWIKSHGIKHDIEHAVDVLLKGNTCRQDVVKVSLLDPVALPVEREISVSYMVNIGGVGLDAKVCERVNAKKKEGKRGKVLYVTSVKINILINTCSFCVNLCNFKCFTVYISAVCYKLRISKHKRFCSFSFFIPYCFGNYIPSFSCEVTVNTRCDIMYHHSALNKKCT
jgi:diacylglycerol kinase family enzyme